MYPFSTTYFSAPSCEPHHHRGRDPRAEMGRRAFVTAYSYDNNPGVVMMQQPQLVSRTVYTERPVMMVPQQQMMMTQPTMVVQQPMMMSQPTVVVQQPMMQSHHSGYSGPRPNRW